MVPLGLALVWSGGYLGLGWGREFMSSPQRKESKVPAVHVHPIFIGIGGLRFDLSWRFTTSLSLFYLLIREGGAEESKNEPKKEIRIEV